MSESGEQSFRDVLGEEIILTDAVRLVILAKHPEVEDFFEHIETVLSSPDEIRRSVSNEKVVLYYRFYDEVLGGKWVVVVVKKADRNFISTIYATDKIKSGDVVWTK